MICWTRGVHEKEIFKSINSDGILYISVSNMIIEIDTLLPLWIVSPFSRYFDRNVKKLVSLWVWKISVSRSPLTKSLNMDMMEHILRLCVHCAFFYLFIFQLMLEGTSELRRLWFHRLNCWQCHTSKTLF